MTSGGSKRLGWQDCDACGRTFEVKYLIDRGGENGWRCPRCGFDNRVGEEFLKNAARKGGLARHGLWSKAAQEPSPAVPT